MQIQSPTLVWPFDSNRMSLNFLFMLAINLLAVGGVFLVSFKVVIAIILLISAILILASARIHILQVLIIFLMLSLFIGSSIHIAVLGMFYAIFALVIFYYLICLCFASDYHYRISAHHFVALLFLLLGVVGFLSAFKNSALSGKGLFEIARHISSGLIFLAVYFLLGDLRTIKRLVKTVIAMSFIVAAYSYMAVFVLGIKDFVVQGFTALRGAYLGLSNPNTVALAIGYSLPFVLSYLAFGHGKKRKRYALLGFLFLFAIWLLWNSRATYIYFFFSVLTLISFHKNRFRYYLLLAVVIILGTILVYSIPTFQEILRLEAGLSYRDQLWKAAIKIIEQNPIWGVGPDSFWKIKFYFMEPSLARNAIGTAERISAHNLLLTRTLELGIGAAIIILTYWSYVVYYFIKHERVVRGSDYYYLYLGSGAIFIGIIFRSFFESGGNILPLLFVAIIFKLPKLISEKPNPKTY